MGRSLQIKASLTTLYGISLFNPNAGTVYVQFYNASSITYGTTVPFYALALTTGQSVNLSYLQGIAFGTALYYTVSTSTSTLTSPVSPILPATVVYA